MQKIIFQAMMLMILPFYTYCQQFQGGLMAGIVGSQVAGDLYSGYNKVGVMGGGYVALLIDKKFTLQLEMEYIQKGSRHNYNPDLPADITYKLNLNYIELPLLLRYRVTDKIEIEAGLAMAALVSHKETQDGQEMINRPGFKSTNFSTVAGISYLFLDRYKVTLRTDNSINSVRNGLVPEARRRYGTEFGQYNDLLVISLFYKL